MEFISFDLETTGILSHDDHIVEIAAIRFKNGEVLDSYHRLVSIDSPIPEQAIAIHGITDEMLEGQASIDKILPEFAEFCGDKLMIAHNAIFDFQFLVRAIQECQQPSPKGFVLDTCNLSRKTFPGLVNYKLSTLCKYLKIAFKESHRAEADAMSCGNLFVKILEKLPFSDDLEEIIKFSGKAPLKFPRSFMEGQLPLF